MSFDRVQALIEMSDIHVSFAKYERERDERVLSEHKQ